MTEEKPDSLFHYTTAGGLKGILEKQCLWATDVVSLNDERELRHIEQILYDDVFVIRKKLSDKILQTNPEAKLIAIGHSGSVEGLVKYETFDFLRLLTKPNLKNKTFVVSFCKHDLGSFSYKDGLLSMWRAYGGDEAYAIEFDFKELENSIEHEFKRYNNCIHFFEEVQYAHSKETIKDKFQDDYKHALDFAERICNDEYSNNNIRTTPEGIISLSKLSIFTKHQGFNEEQEYRLSVNLISEVNDPSDDKSPIKVNEHQKSTFQSIKRLYVFENSELKLPIKRIIVGPHENKEQYANELRNWLEINKHDIPVTISDIPFRGMN